jgi:zinc transport system permease protein
LKAATEMNFIYNIIDAILPFECFSYRFMQNALLAIIMLTPLLALLGTMAVNKRMAFFSDALGHSALAGVGLGVLVGIENEQISLIIFGLFWALLISRINQKRGESADTVISIFSSMGIALGLIILSRDGGFSKYSALLVGDVLAVSTVDLLWLAVSLAIGLLVWFLLYNRLLLTAINPALAQSRGIAANLVEYVFVSLVAVAVMLAIRWVGVLLINALLILPAASARNISKNSAQHALFSVLISLLCGFIGLVVAFYLGTSVGAAVVLCAGFFYSISLLIRHFMI